MISGSLDTIRVWDAVSGHPILRMSTGRIEKKRATIVWSVAILVKQFSNSTINHTKLKLVALSIGRFYNCFWRFEGQNVILEWKGRNIGRQLSKS